MHPTNLSCPSSSTSAYASTYIQRYVRAVLSASGFAKSSGQAIDVLTEVFERYLLLLGSTSQESANHVGRNTACLWDIEQALGQLGSSSSEISDWLSEGGQDVAGHFLSETGEDAEATTLAQRDQEEYGLVLLEARNRHGKADPAESSRASLFYEDVSAQQLQELEELESQDDSRSDDDEDGGRSEDEAHVGVPKSPPPPYPGSPAAIEPGKRKRSASTDSYIPPFFPALPSTLTKDDSSANGERVPAWKNDAEYEREITFRIEKGREQSNLSQKPPAELLQDRPVLPEQVPDSDAKKSTEDAWHRSVPFHASSLATSQSDEDIPFIQDGVHASSASREPSIVSSMRAFANDYPALVHEARSSAPTYLTPTGVAHARAFHQRRALAALLADPSKYIPCDTIFGSTGARPTALPFHPTSSLLITPSTAGNSAPNFTPLRPNGREPPSSTVQTNALYPACRHRMPGNVLNAARLVSGGVGSETFCRMTRIHDPDPILDEQHAERVFHGQPAPKELLFEGNSVLKGALDILTMKRAEERAAAREAAGGDDGLGDDGTATDLAEQMGAKDNKNGTNTRRDRIKVKNGTIVSTWDWISRDYTETMLPGKRFRVRE